MSFTLWIETEHVAEPINDVCNVVVTMASGQRWALNVWTFDFFAEARSGGEMLAAPELADVYMFPPDLFVADLTRPTLERVIGDVLASGEAPAHWRSTSDPDEIAIGTAVRVSSTATLDIAGKYGKVAGVARDHSDTVVSYAVLIFDLERVWSLEPTDVELA